MKRCQYSQVKKTHLWIWIMELMKLPKRAERVRFPTLRNRHRSGNVLKVLDECVNQRKINCKSGQTELLFCIAATHKDRSYLWPAERWRYKTSQIQNCGHTAMAQQILLIHLEVGRVLRTSFRAGSGGMDVPTGHPLMTECSGEDCDAR